MSSLAGLRGDETHQRSDEYLEQSPDQHTADDEHGKDDGDQPEEKAVLQRSEQSRHQSGDEPADEEAAGTNPPTKRPPEA